MKNLFQELRGHVEGLHRELIDMLKQSPIMTEHHGLFLPKEAVEDWQNQLETLKRQHKSNLVFKSIMLFNDNKFL